MRIFTYILLTFILSASAGAQSFSELLSRVTSAPANRQQYLVDSFLTDISSFPIVENDSVVYLLYQGEAEKVLVASDANAWSNTRSPLTRLASTNLWYREETFEADARIDYKFIIGEQWILDPKNPLTAPSGYGPNSELRMPAYEPPEEILMSNSVAHGEMRIRSFHSSILNNTRQASIYLPAGYHQSGERYPLVLFHDGLDYLNLGNAANVLDNLIADRRIPPVIAVFLPAVNRTEEYAGSQIGLYSDFVVNTVLASIDNEFRTRTDSGSRAVIGASNGGHLALYQGMLYPGTLGHVGAQSTNVTPLLIQGYTAASSTSGTIYLDVGTYDIELIITRVNSFRPILQNGGYDFTYREFHEGHSWGSWRARIDDMLEYFFGNLVNVHDHRTVPSRAILLHPPAPNPARDHATLMAEVQHPQRLRLSLFDTRGRYLKNLWSGHCASGTRSFDIDTHSLAPGMYILSLDSPAGRSTQRLLIR